MSIISEPINEVKRSIQKIDASPTKNGFGNKGVDGLLVNVERVDILGVEISAINIHQAISMIDDWLTHRTPRYVCVAAAHCIMDSLNSPELQRIYNSSGLTTPDGMSLVWLMRLRGYHNVGRVYGADLMLATCQLSLAKGYRHFLYGGKPGVADMLADRLQELFPGIQIVGTYSPPFGELTPEEDRAIIDLINATNPDIVWVGMSSPKQDLWMATHRDLLAAPVLIGVGAAFDFLSGHKRQAPIWMQRLGIEWLFRLAMEPRRLWRRYIQYPRFALLALAQTIGLI
jgi:N-acetylglucosaminyldiphosphoundecaprenol N-acetyl-beta-D-mannosaminyltransferase